MRVTKRGKSKQWVPSPNVALAPAGLEVTTELGSPVLSIVNDPAPNVLLLRPLGLEVATQLGVATVVGPPQLAVGYPYTGAGLIYREDWSAYATNSLPWGCYSNCNQSPVISDVRGVLVVKAADPLGVFPGGVTRMLGDNTAVFNQDPGTPGFGPGRTATSGVNLADHGGPKHQVWFRTFTRFSPRWSTIGTTPGDSSYKHFLWHWSGPTGPMVGARVLWVYGSQFLTALEYNQGYPIESTTISKFGTGWDASQPNRLHVGSMYRTTFPVAQDGDGDWYELVLAHLRQPNPAVGRSVWAIRRYTVNGAVLPAAWNGIVADNRHTGGEAWQPVGRLLSGQNRNRNYPEAMYTDFGPYEVIDGSVAANPFGIPGI